MVWLAPDDLGQPADHWSSAKIENAWLATGHNMLGLSLAPATGRLIAELVQGEKPHIDASAFRPKRFG